MKLTVIFLLIVSTSVWANMYDPTMPPWLQKKEVKVTDKKPIKRVKERFNLMQIVTNENGNRAVINGYVLKEGEHIHRAKVEKISAQKVILTRGQQKWILTLEDSRSRVRQ